MASAVDVCNTALAYLGDTATVASIDPPSGSAQSSHCARFFPLALDELLEMHLWNFAATRVALAEVDNPSGSAWAYAYAAPADYVNIISIQDPDATDDYTVGRPWPYSIQTGDYLPTVSTYVPQPYQMSTDADGNDIILTNQENAVARYTRSIDNVGHAPPLFCEALARLLAAKLAGPLLKGDTGRAETKAQMQYFADAFSRAVESDGNQRRLNLTHAPAWMAGR